MTCVYHKFVCHYVSSDVVNLMVMEIFTYYSILVCFTLIKVRLARISDW